MSNLQIFNSDVLISSLNNGITVRVYFEVFNLDPIHADYLVDIKHNNKIYEYLLSGHGIGYNPYTFNHIDEVLERVYSDIKRFGNITASLMEISG